MHTGLDKIEQKSTHILHQVFDKSTEGFQVIDKDWRYVYVNEAVAKQGKSTVSSLIGSTMMEKYPGIENTEMFAQLKRSIKENVGIKMENEFVFPDGKKGWFQLFVHPWSGGVMIFSVDITYRKVAEAKILEIVEELKKSAVTENDKARIEDLARGVENLSKPTITVIQ